MDDITEEDLLVRYNRVEGPFLGWQLARSYHGRTGIAHFGHGGYGFGAEQWQFQTGGEIYTFYGPPEVQSHLATIGAEIHDVADSQDGWLISEEENSVAALFLRRDFQDFYRRFGWSAYTAHNVGGILHMTLRYGRDEFESQASSVSWALHDTRFSRDDFRANPAVSEGIVSSARVDVQLDTRNNRRNPWQGWFINGLFERAGGVLEGDYTFKRYLLDLRRYQPGQPRHETGSAPAHGHCQGRPGDPVSLRPRRHLDAARLRFQAVHRRPHGAPQSRVLG